MSGTGMEPGALIRQAQEMVSVQASCSMEEALALMEETALGTGETIDYLAAEVVGERIRFAPPSD
jgi:AmiR/NasT family two-component response regulator